MKAFTEESLTILAVGAHPDDIELGAAGLVAKAIKLGHRVVFLILTDEDGCGQQRRAESVLAAAELGVKAEDITFAGLRDGHLRADGQSVDHVRRLLRQLRLQPDLVVTHTAADSHNDHVETNRLAHAVFRETAFLHFSIHISAEVDRFSPKVFVVLDQQRMARKAAALCRYPSQKKRVDRINLAKYEASLGHLAGMDRAEAFEIGLQYGASGVWRKTLALSDSDFHRFWAPVVADGTITLLYGAVAHLTPEALLQQNIAHDKLRHAFVDAWPPPYPLREHYANTEHALALAATGNLIVTGSPADNRVVAQLQQMGWTTANGRHDDGLGEHIGQLARVENPFRANAHLVSATGTTPLAIRKGLELLTDPGWAPHVTRTFDNHVHATVTFAIHSATGQPRLMSARAGSDMLSHESGRVP